MRFKCWECDCEFDEYVERQECVGEYWGMPAFQTEYSCPYCGGQFDLKEVVDRANAEEAEISANCMMESLAYAGGY